MKHFVRFVVLLCAVVAFYLYILFVGRRDFIIVHMFTSSCTANIPSCTAAHTIIITTLFIKCLHFQNCSHSTIILSIMIVSGNRFFREWKEDGLWTMCQRYATHNNDYQVSHSHQLWSDYLPTQSILKYH